MQGLDSRKLALAAAACLIAIAAAIYAGIHTFTQPKPAYPADFAKFGPNGPPGSHPPLTGSTPGGR